ncbi:hypothetical protein ACWGJ2_19875 [Streptomyces sp. NPDC054796]
MRDLSNQGWRETPFGSVTSPVHHPATWLTGLSLLWGEAGTEPTLMGAAGVFMKIHRTCSLPVSAPLAHFGYRVLVPEAVTDGQNRTLLAALDVLLVQARRLAQVIAWHNGADDLHLLRVLADGDSSRRHPGITATADAWHDRDHREPGTARCVDTALDLGPAGLISETGVVHGLEPVEQFAGPRQQVHAQQACEALAEGRGGDAREELAVSVLAAALVTALLGGRHTDRLHWDALLSVRGLLETVAWDMAPSVLGGVPHPHSQ